MNELVLVVLGASVGVVSVVVGGGFFWSIPLWQFLFPDITLGVLIGNLKVGSMFRGIASTIVTRDQVDWKEAVSVAWPMMLGAIIGVSLIANLSQQWALPCLILAVIVTECAHWLSKRMSMRHFFIGSLVLGIYFGVLGAGGGILIVTLLRLKQPDDEKIARVKSQARFLELLIGIIAVIAHFLHGNIVSSLWIWWSIGSLLGGYAGGKMLVLMDQMKGAAQKRILRISYALSFLPFLRG